MVRFSYDMEIRHESVKNTPKASTNQIRIKRNSWQFLTIREIFSLKLGIQNVIYPCLGITSKIVGGPMVLKTLG